MHPKTNALGDTLWTKSYGASGSEFANTITQTSDGGYIFAGYTINDAIDSAQGSIYLAKLNSGGNLLWKKVLGPSKEYTDAYSIKQTSDKGYIITGYTDGYNEINGDVFLLKTDSLGNSVFVKTYGNKGADWAYAAEQTPDGGFIIGGTYSTDSTSLDLDAYIIKTDANGDTLWTKTFGGPGNEYGQSLTQTADGGYVLGGYTNSFGNGNYDAFLLKVNANGDTVFTRSFGGYNDDEANAVFQTSDGGYALSGQTNSFGKGGYDFYFVKTDANGNSSCFQTNIHAAKKTTVTFVNTVAMKQDTIHVVAATDHPIIYTGAAVLDNCVTVGINELKIKNAELRIFPNPANSNFTIYLADFSGKAKINITNLFGENVYAFSGEMMHQKELNSADFTNGTYFIQVVAEGRIHNGKILVNK
jgi:hypothetical protein